METKMDSMDLLAENIILHQQLTELKSQLEQQSERLIEWQVKSDGLIEDQMSRVRISDSSSFRKLTENIPVLVYVYHNSKVIYVNPAVENALGYTFEEMIEKDFWDICHPDYKELIRSRGLARLRGEKAPSNYEFKIMKKNGEAMWVDVFFGDTRMAGEIVGIVGAYDITESKLLKAQLQAARDELEARVQQRTEELSRKNQELTILNKNLNNVVMNMSDGVVIVNQEGEFEFLNSVFKQTWGNLLEPIKAKLQEDIIKGRSRYISSMFKKRKAFQDEEVILSTPDGQVHLLASGTPIINEMNLVNSGVIILRPIKEIHKLVNRFSGAKARFRFEDIITGSEMMTGLIENAKMAASSMSNVLIEGESGTGKELFAQAMHNHSRRNKGPFIALNCGAIPRELIGSELFGYEEGAFTGARKGGNPGKFELASGGTILLDEIGDMPFEQQVALLRVIQEKKITRIGGNQMIPVDVRIICATNKNLQVEIQREKFRQDLYYRLNVISIKIPPLRARREDIPLLLWHFLENVEPYSVEKEGSLNEALLSQLMAYDWPGNVRELQNVVERMLNAANGLRLGIEHLPPEIDPVAPSLQSFCSADSMLETKGKTIREIRDHNRHMMAEEERKQMLQLLQLYRGNVTQVAKEMGISRTTLYKKMQHYRIDQ